MRKVVLLVLFIGVSSLVRAQSIEVLENNRYVKTEIKNKFLFFQEMTIKNTCSGIDNVYEKDIVLTFANKSLYQLMYWRYDDLYFEKEEHIASIGSVSNTKPDDNFMKLGKKLFAMGVIKNIILD